MGPACPFQARNKSCSTETFFIHPIKQNISTMSAQEADNTYNEPLDYEDPAEQEPYVDTIMDDNGTSCCTGTADSERPTLYSCTTDRSVSYSCSRISHTSC